MNRRRQAIVNGWRSGLEEDVASSLEARGASFGYETLKLEWTAPATKHKYTPDFIVTSQSGKEIIVETKGRWTAADRKKMKLVVEQHPDKDIRMVFQRASTRLSKVSKTTYAAWCDKHLGIPWAEKDIPTAWLLE